MSIVETLSIDNPVFLTYGFWASVLVLKVVAMAEVVIMARIRKKAVHNDEDRVFFKPEDRKDVQLTVSDPDVERVRRAHLNDLENCVPFLIISFIYVLTNPNAFIAVNLIRVSVIARIVHTYLYLNAFQPYRKYAYQVMLFTMVFMSLSNILYFLQIFLNE